MDESLEPPVVPMSIFRSRKKVMIFRYVHIKGIIFILNSNLKKLELLGELVI